MAKFDVLSIPLDDSGVFYDVERVAYDDFMCGDVESDLFFFGKLINDCCLMEGTIDESKYYTKCPNCADLIQLEKKPVDGAEYTCPHCNNMGNIFDYRDPFSSVNDHIVFHYAALQHFDKGFCLRLFDLNADYDGRDINDYRTIEYSPFLIVKEVAREYWYEGQVSYFRNSAEVDCEPKFVKVNTVDDESYLIINYCNDFDPMGSELIADILYDDCTSKTFIESIARRGSYKAFKTLKKYGFKQLLTDFVYVPNIFGDSKKISEVLQLDYNQVIAYNDAEDIGAHVLLTLRELKEYGLSFSDKNFEIMSVLYNKVPLVFTKENVKKTFKYLRNQMSRSTNKHVASDYFDYISDCRKLGLNIESSDIRYPTDLSKAHTRTAALVKIEDNRDMDERIREVYERCREYCEFSDGDFCIVMPFNTEQIIREGKVQSHCVGGYAERMAKGEDIILFLRKVIEPDKPFYTIEIRPNLKKLELVQCRGYHNEDPDIQTRAKVDEFLNVYNVWFNGRKCDEVLSSHRKYYKAVCKSADGRYISHWDNKTEYRIGEVIEATMDHNPDLTAVPGIHIASLDFAKNYGDAWENATILEIEVDMRDVCIPDAKDQLRTKRGKVLREVPLSELGDWGVRHKVVA